MYPTRNVSPCSTPYINTPPPKKKKTKKTKQTLLHVRIFFSFVLAGFEHNEFDSAIRRQRPYPLDHFRLQILKVQILLSIQDFFTSSPLFQVYLNISLVWRERIENVFNWGGKSWSTFLSNCTKFNPEVFCN